MKHRFLAMLCAAVISVSAFSTPVQQLIGTAVTAEAAVTVAVPTPNLKSGSYYINNVYYLTLSSSASNAKIYYSLNGAAYKLFTGKIGLTKSSTVKCYAVVNGKNSSIATYSYKLYPRLTNSVAAGTYTGAKTVKLSSTTAGVQFYYTLDGSTPTTASAKYNSATGIKLTKSCTLRVLPYRMGWAQKIYTYSYTIKGTSSASTTQTTPASDSILDKYTVKYGYSTLTAQQKKLYAAIYNGIAAHKASISVSSYNCTIADTEKAFYAVAYDNPQFFWLGIGYDYDGYSGNTVLSIAPIYSRTAAEVNAIKPKLQAAAQTIINGALKKTTLFERVKYIHDAVVNKTTYTSNGTDYVREADGVLLNGKALCEGYSNAFSYLCQSIGINTACITGKGNGGAHMWNIIKLDNQWYHMDVTFDDPTGGAAVCVYDYFCLTEKQILKDHTIDSKLGKPTATATKYNYYTYNGLTKYTSVTTAFNALMSQAAANYKKGVKTTIIYCDSSLGASLKTKIKSSAQSTLKSSYGLNVGYSLSIVNSTVTLTLTP